MKRHLMILGVVAFNMIAAAPPARAAWETDICKGTTLDPTVACCPHCWFFGCDC